MNALVFAMSALLGAAASTPSGVQIPVTMVSTVSSRTAKVGDTFTFRTLRTVEIDGVTVPAGTIGTGTVGAVAPAGGTKRGSVTLVPHVLQLASGATIPVGPFPSAQQQRARRHVFPLPLPLGGLFFVGAIVNPGGDVTLGPGTNFTIVTTGPIRPRSANAAASPSTKPSSAA